MANKKTDVFAACHPAVNFFYFLLVLLTTMFVSHPVLLALSFAGAASYAIRLKGWKSVVKFNMLGMIPAMIIVAFINPAFNHYGVTTLFYLKTGPVTLEAIVYGIVLASMLFIAILWFSCYNEVMTTDKFVYLFGRVIPSLSLVLSMVFRFVPRFSQQLKVIRNSQKSVGRDLSNGNIIQKVKHGITLFSILVTWALENAIDTSDSMSARGYGLKGRTAFSIFRFDKRDGIITSILLGLTAVCFSGFYTGAASAQYNPKIIIGGIPVTPQSIAVYLAWAGICFFPFLLGLWEDVVFRRLKAKANMERNLPWYMTDVRSRPVVLQTADAQNTAAGQYAAEWGTNE
ncbi:MAG: energy-coupling factor transporter transmembrane component T [Lachnospiraceae bacterium]|nr:energy-coupling factor transporter transmembrane component T [Lachnospiraceae bacterium]